MPPTKDAAAHILTEFLEVAVHNILHCRKLYPDSIFMPFKKYGVAIVKSIHPDLNEYITQSLKAVLFHAKAKQLRRLIICFKHENIVYERYVFDMLDLGQITEDKSYFIQLEQHLRDYLLKLHGARSLLEPLPEDSTFELQIHTTFYSAVDFNESPEYEDFPWIQVDKNTNNISSANIIPLHTLETNFLTLQMYIEKLETIETAVFDV